MNTITKERLINYIITDCKELNKCINYIDKPELTLILTNRIKNHNLSYKMDTETQYHLNDLMQDKIYNRTNRNFKQELQGLIK